MRRTVILIILDGWGIGAADESNPIFVVKPPTIGMLGMTYPVTSLQTSGISVGLPWGEVGNSEVGHLTLGAGKVLYQHYPKITIAIRNRSFYENEALRQAFIHAKQNNSAVNLVGLLSKANVHASFEHLETLLKMAAEEGVEAINLHLFGDGKDSPPKSIDAFLKLLPKDKLATLIGRYYAQDREGNWQFTKETYELLVGGRGANAENVSAAIEATYARGFTEDLLPALVVNNKKIIQENDAVIFFNFREDGMQQLGAAFLDEKFDKFPVKKFQNLYTATMTEYQKGFRAAVAFPSDVTEFPLGRVLSDTDRSQLRLAETYKYAHITSFFNGYRQDPFKNEYRVLIPSISTFRPDQNPKMMASAVTERLLEAIRNRAFDFILVNYSNADTIAHTGNYTAGLEAVKIIDAEIAKILPIVEEMDAILFITSDHGNIETMMDTMTGRTQNQHDPNPVPFYFIAKEVKHHKFINWPNLRNDTLGVLSDVAPTILELMEIPKPPEMTGHSLLKHIL